ncbi:MAG: 4'-phosphopantetheinyl transferase family protein [Pirellulales bacterium]
MWRIAADRPADSGALRRLLSDDEQAKADRFRFDRDRRRAIVRRAALRAIVAEYVNASPEELKFAYGAQGKPRLADRFPGPGIQFNVSFSGELALCAVALSPLGIDVEACRHVENAALVAKHFFTAEEIAAQHAAEDPNQVFLRHWTRKEALIKATGSGLSVPLNSFDVSWPSDDLARSATLPDASGNLTSWWLCDLVPSAGWLAALATARPMKNIAWHDWADLP